jgi:hypothetical protein
MKSSKYVKYSFGFIFIASSISAKTPSFSEASAWTSCPAGGWAGVHARPQEFCNDISVQNFIRTHPKKFYGPISLSEAKSQSSKYFIYVSGCLFASSSTLNHIPFFGIGSS